MARIRNHCHSKPGSLPNQTSCLHGGHTQRQHETPAVAWQHDSVEADTEEEKM